MLHPVSQFYGFMSVTANQTALPGRWVKTVCAVQPNVPYHTVIPHPKSFGYTWCKVIWEDRFNPFRSYVGPRPTVCFSRSAPMSEGVRHCFVAFVCPLSEPVRRFSSCSTDFNQQIAQVVLFLFLHVFLF
jgi:hypothetical protein